MKVFSNNPHKLVVMFEAWLQLQLHFFLNHFLSLVPVQNQFIASQTQLSRSPGFLVASLTRRAFTVSSFNFGPSGAVLAHWSQTANISSLPELYLRKFKDLPQAVAALPVRVASATQNNHV